MTTEKQNKLNQLVTHWKRGTVYTQRYLSQLGFNHDLVKSYRRNNWLESVGTGAYKMKNDTVDWFGGLYAIQVQLQLPVHTGGKTSLELQGLAHYLSEHLNQCFLYGEKGLNLPSWFQKNDWGIRIIYKATQLFTPDPDLGLTEYSHKEFSILMSSPERAILEMLSLVPGKHGFDESYRIMENLTTLRPDVLQQLLKNCQSVKTKRLFMYMAEKAEHAWLDTLNIDKVGLGSGKRVIVENGMLDKKYNITVPRDFQ